jgi:hypothetical protein
MKPVRKMEFLRAKADEVIKRARDERGRTTLTALFDWIRPNSSNGPLPSEAIRRADELLADIVEAFNPDIRSEIEMELQREFGCIRLCRGKSRADPVERALKTGIIPNDDDARRVGEFMANTVNIELIGKDEYQRLGKIYDSYKTEGSGKTRKSK